jgi:hypothetical protein
MYKTNALSVDILTLQSLTNHKSGVDVRVCVCVCVRDVCVCVCVWCVCVCVYTHTHTHTHINLIDSLLRIITIERQNKISFLLNMHAMTHKMPCKVCHYCRESDSSDRPKLEDTTNPTTHGDWRLYVQD